MATGPDVSLTDVLEDGGEFVGVAIEEMVEPPGLDGVHERGDGGQPYRLGGSRRRPQSKLLLYRLIERPVDPKLQPDAVGLGDAAGQGLVHSIFAVEEGRFDDVKVPERRPGDRRESFAELRLQRQLFQERMSERKGLGGIEQAVPGGVGLQEDQAGATQPGLPDRHRAHVGGVSQERGGEEAMGAPTGVGRPEQLLAQRLEAARPPKIYLAQGLGADNLLGNVDVEVFEVDVVQVQHTLDVAFKRCQAVMEVLAGLVQDFDSLGVEEELEILEIGQAGGARDRRLHVIPHRAHVIRRDDVGEAAQRSIAFAVGGALLLLGCLGVRSRLCVVARESVVDIVGGRRPDGRQDDLVG